MELHSRPGVPGTTSRPRSTRTVSDGEHLRVSVSDDVVIVEPVDRVDRHCMDALDRLLSEVDAPAVIDLRHLAPSTTDGLEWIDPRRWGRTAGSVCIVTDRSNDRARRAAARCRLAVFGQPADAVQALLLADTGYGDGWS